MTESFVDLTYRGLSLGRRVKLAQVRPSTAYLELPAPMPVGTHIAVITDDTVAFDAIVTEIHEQTGGSERPPGMTIAPKLDGEAALAWWKVRVTLPELAPPAPRVAPPVVPQVVVVAPRPTNPGMGVPELIDDGRETGVIDAVEPEESTPKLVDDGRQTIAMNAVDLAALGLDPGSSDSGMPAVEDDDGDGNGNGTSNGHGDKPPEPRSSRKKRRRR